MKYTIINGNCMMYKIFTAIELMDVGLNREEIDSALYPLFLKERKQYFIDIIKMQQSGLYIIKKNKIKTRR
jgi:hypothetical protein